MPGWNGMGPMGFGPGSGWGRGPCGGGGRWGARGAGYGAGCGGGYGGGGGRGRGFGRGLGFGRGAWGAGEMGWSERQVLENEEARLRDQLEAVRGRLGELREDPREPAE